jgi:hypothetical protein
MALRTKTPVGVTVEPEFKTDVPRLPTDNDIGICEKGERSLLFPDRMTAAIAMLKKFGDEVLALHFTDVYGYAGAAVDEDGRERDGRRGRQRQEVPHDDGERMKVNESKDTEQTKTEPVKAG